MKQEPEAITFLKWVHNKGYRVTSDPMNPVVTYERGCSRFLVKELYEIYSKENARHCAEPGINTD
jgi:hypothetical protein